ncbi:MAG: hypothetical protein R2705_24260 [Ilumatobacteraceae bacterium]
MLDEGRLLAIHAMQPPTVLRTPARGGGLPMTDKTYRAKSGRTLTDAEIETLADESASPTPRTAARSSGELRALPRRRLRSAGQQAVEHRHCHHHLPLNAEER